MSSNLGNNSIRNTYVLACFAGDNMYYYDVKPCLKVRFCCNYGLQISKCLLNDRSSRSRGLRQSLTPPSYQKSSSFHRSNYIRTRRYFCRLRFELSSWSGKVGMLVDEPSIFLAIGSLTDGFTFAVKVVCPLGSIPKDKILLPSSRSFCHTQAVGEKQRRAFLC